jgi:scyllo-inositol 2-dehydrogenase (NADP+)
VQEQQLIANIRPYQDNWANHRSDNFGVVHTQQENGSERIQIESVRGCYEMFYRNIADAINEKAVLQFPAQQALLAVEMLLAAEESNVLQKTILIKNH